MVMLGLSEKDFLLGLTEVSICVYILKRTNNRGIESTVPSILFPDQNLKLMENGLIKATWKPISFYFSSYMCHVNMPVYQLLN